MGERRSNESRKELLPLNPAAEVDVLPEQNTHPKINV